MKHLSIYLLSIIFFACGQSSHEGKSNLEFEHNKQDSLTQTSDTINISEDSSENLEIFRQFATNFNPKSILAQLPELPDSVKMSMDNVKRTQPKEFEKYLLLIFVNLYRAHLECCHQSYEIRRQPPKGLDKKRDPLVYEINELTKSYSDNDRIEMISSHIGFEYIKSHQYLLKFEPISNEFDKIELIQKKIADGEYWH